MPTGAPDWQTVVSIVPSVTAGAPDWEKVVVGPGGVPISGGGGAGATLLDWALDGSWVQTIPASLCLNQQSYNNGMIQLGVITPLKAITVAKARIYVGGAQAVVADENYIGIYEWDATTGDLTLVAATAAGACDSPFSVGANAIIPIALSASVTLSASSTYYGAILVNPTVTSAPPTFLCLAYSVQPVMSTPAGAALFGASVALTYTSLPSTLTAAQWTQDPSTSLSLPQLAFSA